MFKIKSASNINKVVNKVADQFIICDNGDLYFDLNSSTRIQLGTDQIFKTDEYFYEANGMTLISTDLVGIGFTITDDTEFKIGSIVYAKNAIGYIQSVVSKNEIEIKTLTDNSDITSINTLDINNFYRIGTIVEYKGNLYKVTTSFDTSNDVIADVYNNNADKLSEYFMISNTIKALQDDLVNKANKFTQNSKTYDLEDVYEEIKTIATEPYFWYAFDYGMETDEVPIFDNNDGDEFKIGETLFNFANNKVYQISTLVGKTATWIDVTSTYTKELKDGSDLRIIQKMLDGPKKLFRAESVYSDTTKTWSIFPYGDVNAPDNESIVFADLDGTIKINDRFTKAFVTTGTSSSYNVDIPGYIPQLGDKITIIPHVDSTVTPGLSINNGDKLQLYVQKYINNLEDVEPFKILANKPIDIMYNPAVAGVAWKILGISTKILSTDIDGVISVANGGTGRSSYFADDKSYVLLTNGDEPFVTRAIDTTFTSSNSTNLITHGVVTSAINDTISTINNTLDSYVIKVNDFLLSKSISTNVETGEIGSIKSTLTFSDGSVGGTFYNDVAIDALLNKKVDKVDTYGLLNISDSKNEANIDVKVLSTNDDDNKTATFYDSSTIDTLLSGFSETIQYVDTPYDGGSELVNAGNLFKYIGAVSQYVGTNLKGVVLSHDGNADNSATGINSVAAGYQANASKDYSFAQGYQSNANGICAIAMGDGVNSSGHCSSSFGLSTSAKANYSFVHGKFNIVDNQNKYAHIVGNGDDETHSNAYTLDWNGNAWFANNITIGENNDEVITTSVIESMLTVERIV